MSRNLSFLACVAALAAAGCTGTFVPKIQYDRDVDHLRECMAALERDNESLRGKADEYDRLKARMDISDHSKEAYAKMAEQLKKALAGLPEAESGEVFVDPKTGAFVFANSVLFSSGSFKISARGKEVLKRFARNNRTSKLRIVGHTDAQRIVKASTKASLHFDINKELSALRALSVGLEITRNGIPERNWWIEGRGSMQPRKVGDHQANRRVEIFLVK